jgi:hypothetical protein
MGKKKRREKLDRRPTIHPGLYAGITVPPVTPTPVVRVAQEILAWRAWNVDDEGYLLSITAGCRWDGPVFDNGVAPQVDSYPSWVVFGSKPGISKTLGVHATRERGRWTGMVYGVVALSGSVIEGEDGYRAQRAAIRSLIVTQPTANRNMLDLSATLADRYQCDVTIEPAAEKPPDTWSMVHGITFYSWDDDEEPDKPPCLRGYSRHSQEVWAG